jgi:hypothetical protein
MAAISTAIIRVLAWSCDTEQDKLYYFIVMIITATTFTLLVTLLPGCAVDCSISFAVAFNVPVEALTPTAQRIGNYVHRIEVK